jgi:SAM-dependent methyltransferase
MWSNTVLNEYYTREQELAFDGLCLELKGAKVLDLGCGTGRFSRRIASAGAVVTGIDFSKKTLDVARSQSSGINPFYVKGNLFKMNFQSRFDLILSTATLAMACPSHDEIRDALTRIGKALRPGGVLFLIEPFHRGFLSRVLDMDLKTFLNLLEETGLSASSVKPLAFWPARLALAYLPLPRFLTATVYRLGSFLMKLPFLCRLGDYWAVEARITPGGQLDRKDISVQGTAECIG